MMAHSSFQAQAAISCASWRRRHLWPGRRRLCGTSHTVDRSGREISCRWLSSRDSQASPEFNTAEKLQRARRILGSVCSAWTLSRSPERRATLCLVGSRKNSA